MLPMRITLAGCSTRSATVRPFSDSPSSDPPACAKPSGPRIITRGSDGSDSSGARVAGGSSEVMASPYASEVGGGSGRGDDHDLADVCTVFDRRWAAAISSRVNVAWTMGRIVASSTIGQACSRTLATIAAFSAAGRARRVVAMIAPRLRSKAFRSSSPFAPPCSPMTTSLPSVASS